MSPAFTLDALIVAAFVLDVLLAATLWMLLDQIEWIASHPPPVDPLVVELLDYLKAEAKVRGLSEAGREAVMQKWLGSLE